MVLACEVGGRFSEECIELIRQLLREKIRNVPSGLQGTLRMALRRRWYGILSIAIQRAVAINLLGEEWEMPTVFPLPGIEELIVEADIGTGSRLL